MASSIKEDECPVSHIVQRGDKSPREAHVATCIESHISNSVTQESESIQYQSPVSAKEDQCRDMTKGFDSDKARESHVAACIASKQSMNATIHSKADDGLDVNHAQKSDNNVGDQKGTVAQVVADRRRSSMRRWFSSLGGDPKTKEEKMQQRLAELTKLMHQRWGPPGSPRYELVMRYWVATRMQRHWESLREEHPRDFKNRLTKGYMEPIPTAWVQDRRLAYQYPEGSYWETPAEKRLYYFLNNGTMSDGSRPTPIRPLNIVRDRYTIIRRGNERNARQVPIDPRRLTAYQSPADVFHMDRQSKSQEYSAQVQNVVYEARARALHELAEGILHGTDHLETMLLIDVSGSMTWNPHNGVWGPDGMVRYHDQPANISLVEHLVHRVLHHMIPRTQREHPHQTGIPTVTFSSFGRYVGELSATDFRRDWRSKIRLGGMTQVMQGWQVVKNTFFQHQHSTAGHGRLDPVFGWQPTPGMPKLSLLVFLDGEANDMDEFEMELLGETWAYVTIALVGMENCPHHHSHAIELERVAKFNPHVGFFDVHGRVCERLVVEDLLSSVYPVDPPQYSEIVKPEYDLPVEELPAYSAK